MWDNPLKKSSVSCSLHLLIGEFTQIDQYLKKIASSYKSAILIE
jgi:hypothetical protein